MRKGFGRQINAYRILDANINRAKEGLRVCEEIARFILNSRSFTASLKRIRHKIDSLLDGFPAKESLISKRQSRSDVGRFNLGAELIRKDYRDIFLANMQRVKESLRVLEEFAKLGDARTAAGFKKIRYGIYEIEKKIIKRLAPLCNHR
ncbi:MAG: thiamine-phosphate pyrophosphorylase [Candidatus Omnitrophica bacterium]|nr:thiamine-phosphate pyrophosphorylase [Candidatus Omnitrophota bacterium]